MPLPYRASPPPQCGWGVRRLSCHFPGTPTLRFGHKMIPSPPERAHLHFICERRPLAFHASRNIGPRHLTIRETALTRFEHLDIIRSSESAGSQKRQEVIKPQSGVLGALFDRCECPCVHFHIVRRNRKESPHGNSHNIVDYQVGENSQVAAGLTNSPRTLRAKAFVEATPNFCKKFFAIFSEWGNPMGDRPAPRTLILDHRMSIAEIDNLLNRRSGKVTSSKVDADISQKGE